MNPKTIAVVSVLTLLIGGLGFLVLLQNSRNNGSTSDSSNVVVSDGTQVITIKAKGGYYPRTTATKAGIPGIIKVETRGTFDCSSSLTIPDLDYRKNLPPTGETLIDVPAQKPGTVLRGLCSMGMYNFEIHFE